RNMASRVNVLQIIQRGPPANGDYLLKSHLSLSAPEFLQVWPRSTDFPSNSCGRVKFNFLSHFENVKDAFYSDDPSDVHNLKWFSAVWRGRRNLQKILRAKLSSDLINKLMPSSSEMLQLTYTFGRYANCNCGRPTKIE